MEVVRGWSHRVFPIGDTSRVGEVRRYAAQLSSEQMWTETDAGRLAIVATELATNLLRHAVGGEMWIACRTPFDEIEIIAVDRGPGIADLPEAMRDGASSRSGSAGTGLGAMSRLADDFDLHSTAAGTVCVARLRPHQEQASSLSRRLGAICLALQPELVSGDGWAMAAGEGGATVLVVDGLGHGPLAAAATQSALAGFAEVPAEPLDGIVRHCHESLQGTRGAALLAIRLQGDSVQSCGAGNVAARVFTGVKEHSIVGQHGTAGLKIQAPQVSWHERPRHSVVAVHSDGITARWRAADYIPLLGRDATLLAAVILWQNTRGRDDATVVVLHSEELP